jgi:cytoskeletal protein RodZ
MSTETKHLPLVHNETLHWGATLRAARVAKKLSEADIAQALKLTVAQVIAMENESLVDVHPSPVFVKGYVSSYAHLLGVSLSPDDLARLSGQETLHNVNQIQETLAHYAPRHKKRRWWLFGLFLLAVLTWQFVADAQLGVLINK